MPFILVHRFLLPCFLIFCFLFFSNILSANPDTTNLKYFSNISSIPFSKFSAKYDTLLDNVHNYDPLYKNDFYFSQGNIGHAHSSLVFNTSYNPGFIFGINSFDQYLFHPENIQYGIPAASMTDIYYIMGAKKEQSLNVKHWQRINKSLSSGLQLRMINSPGAYKRQKSDIKNFALYSHLLTKNEKYGIIIHYLHNKIRVNENGGIENDTIFEENKETDRELIDIRLDGASNFIKENSIYFKQYYALGKIPKSRDTIEMKSVRFINPGQISHSFKLLYHDNVYRDVISDSLFYLNTLDKLNTTYDSLRIFTYENTLFWTNRKPDKHAFVLDVGLKHQHTKLFQGTEIKMFNNLIYTGFITSSPFKDFRATGDISLTKGSYFSGDLETGFNVEFNSSKFTTEGEFRFASYHTPYFFSHFESNHFKWNNDFLNVKTLTGYFVISGLGFDFSLKLSKLINFVYLNTLASPDQFDGYINYLMASLEKKVSLKRWVFKGKFIYQNSTDRQIILTPDYFTSLTIYYRNTLFNKACELHTGIEGFLFSSFYSPDYMPALKSFYIQNSKKVGRFVYPQIFVDLQIKRARIFLKYVNPVFTGNYNFYLVPHYPLQDGGFRFGLSWMFYN